jgi:hypothetical protein
MQRRLARRSPLIAALLCFACFSSTGPDDFYGIWVGDEVQLTLAETLARFETPCWVGNMSIPLIVDDDRFTAPATLVSQGGAGMTETRLVEFTGRIIGNRLTLTLVPAALGLGPYELHRGSAVSLPGCPQPPE